MYALRSELVVSSARQALLAHWRKAESRELRNLLVELMRDERIMAAAACAADLTALAKTPDFPSGFSCRKVGTQVRPEPKSPPTSWSSWHTVASLPAGGVYLSAIPVIEADQALGFVILVHDMSFVERREGETRYFLWLAFGILGLTAAVITLVAARLYWHGWSTALRLLLRGDGVERPEFNPILRDVRELYDRILKQEGGSWTPERLRNTLRRHLHGERIVILANREPYIHVHGPDKTIVVQHPASGLVTALEPVMRACSGVWIAHGNGSADRETVDARGHIRVPPGTESYTLRRVWLSKEEERGYYYGFANEGLWPLCHLAHARPIFRTDDWEYYQKVNRKFAEAVCEEVDTEDPIILVQDYHFALAPRLIRERLPRATVITFWHIPWPNAEHFGICPWRKEILDGMLGSSILGFHTQFHCNNFIDSVDRYLESRIDREHNAIVQSGRSTLVRAYPISPRVAGTLVEGSAVGCRLPHGCTRRAWACAGCVARCWRGSAGLHQGESRSGCSPSSGCSNSDRSWSDASPLCSSRRRAAWRSSVTARSTKALRSSPIASTSDSPVTDGGPSCYCARTMSRPKSSVTTARRTCVM